MAEVNQLRREAINVQLAVLPTNNSINDSTTSPDLPINVFPFFYFSFSTIQERQWYMIRNDRFSSHNDFKECVWVSE